MLSLSERMERPVVRIPFESLSREFRNAQKLVEREVMGAVQSVRSVNEELRSGAGRDGEGGAGGSVSRDGGRGGGQNGENGGGERAPRASECESAPINAELKAKLSETADRLRSLKRKLLCRVETEKVYLQRCVKRLRHLRDCRAAGLSFDANRASAPALGVAAWAPTSPEQVELETPPKALHGKRSSNTGGGEASRDNLRVAGSRPAIDEALSQRSLSSSSSSAPSSAAAVRARLRREFM